MGWWDDDTDDADRRLLKLEHRTQWLRGEVIALWVLVAILVLAGFFKG